MVLRKTRELVPIKTLNDEGVVEGGGGVELSSVMLELTSHGAYKSLFGVPSVDLRLRRFIEADDTTQLFTSSGDSLRSFCDMCLRIAPATCGVAMDVPLSVVLLVGPVCPVDSISVPGAIISTQSPQLE